MISKKKDREEYARYVAKELGFFIDICDYVTIGKDFRQIDFASVDEAIAGMKAIKAWESAAL